MKALQDAQTAVHRLQGALRVIGEIIDMYDQVDVSALESVLPDNATITGVTVAGEE